MKNFSYEAGAEAIWSELESAPEPRNRSHLPDPGHSHQLGILSAAVVVLAALISSGTVSASGGPMCLLHTCLFILLQNK